MNATFDDFDVYVLANRFTVPELRHEIFKADIKVKKAKVSELFIGTPYEDVAVVADRFPWADYSAACREAVKAIQDRDKKHPPPALPGKRIDIEGIKDRTDIYSLIAQFTNLKKSGHNRFTGKCPLHEDRHPSMTVYADNQSWHCFQCNRGGDVFDFIMAVNSCDFKQAAAALGGV